MDEKILSGNGYVDNNIIYATGYRPLFQESDSSSSKGQYGTPYARKVNKPMDCYGEDFEIFNQLKSPEWQLC